MANEQPPSPDGAPRTTDPLQLGAAVRPVGHGRQGLLWDPVAQLLPTAREWVRDRVVPVATAAFDGTTADYWAQHWSDEQLDRLDVLHVAVDATRAPVGWGSGRRADWGGRRVFYAASAGVAPDIRAVASRPPCGAASWNANCGALPCGRCSWCCAPATRWSTTRGSPPRATAGRASPHLHRRPTQGPVERP